ncbi:MAG: hypothetical protein ACI8X3_002889, partial [Saprospiraceae bacterium]
EVVSLFCSRQIYLTGFFSWSNKFTRYSTTFLISIIISVLSY